MPRVRPLVAAFATLFTLMSVGETAHAGLPLVNLTVSWRLDEGASTSARTQVVQGQVIVDSNGQVVGRTGLGATAVQTQRDRQVAQVLQVLNGRQARLFVGQQVARQSWQLVWAPGASQGGAMAGGGSTASTGTAGQAAGGAWAVQPQTQWVDLGDGLVVRPRWGAGRQPVELDIEARSSRAAVAATPLGGGFSPDGQVNRSEVMTTLVLPLGQWMLLARSGGASSGAAGSRGSTWSTQDVAQDAQHSLWVKVSTDTGLGEAPR